MKYLLALVFIASLLCPATGLAEPAKQNFAEPGHLFRDLNLNDEQRQQMKQLFEQRKELRSQKESQQEERRALRDLIQNDNISDEEIMRRVETLNAQQSELNRARMQQLLEMRRILTPEQRQRARQIMEERRAHMQERLTAGERPQRRAWAEQSGDRENNQVARRRMGEGPAMPHPRGLERQSRGNSAPR